MRALRCAGLALTLAAGVAPGLAAQATPQDSVRAVVQEFFRAMTARDSAATRRVLLEADGFYWATGTGPKGTFLERRSNGPYLESLGKPGPVLQERMFSETIHVHGALAVVWTPYDFHVDGKLSHCGVDAFTLLRTAEGWKIVTVVYTVEPEGCRPG